MNVRIAPATTDVERRRQHVVLAGGGAVIAILLAYLLWPDTETALPAEVELAAAPAPPPQTVPPALTAAPPPIAAAPVPNYQLFGIGGGGERGRAAIIGLPNGSQRVVPAGRAIAPGIIMKEVGPNFAVLTTPDGEMRLEFGKAAQPATPNASGSGVQGVTTPAASLSNPSDRQQMTTRYRLGMEPRKQGPNITGYRLKGDDLPLLAAAGLRPGDTLLSVNGEVLDSEERFFALAETLRSAPVSQIIYERNGTKMSAQVNAR